MQSLARASVWALCLVVLAAGAARAEDVDPDKEAAARYGAGAKAFEESDYQKAIEELQASVRAKPTAKAYLLLGNAYTKVGQLDDAKSAFERFLQLDPKSSKAKTIERLVKDLGVLATTRFKIATSPPGATVYVDLRAEGAKGKTPTEVPVAPGRHRVILELEGYDTATITEAVAVEGKEVPLSATLKQKGCDVQIASQSGVSARVDGGQALQVPAALRVSLGEHKVDFAGPGYLPKSRTFKCENYKGMLIDERLDEAPNGMLALRAPEGSKITVDGKPVERAAAEKLALPPGNHKVDVIAPGKAPWRVTAAVRPGETVDLQPVLDVGGGSGATGIAVSAEPKDATVYVDGKPAKAGELVATTPGPHEVEVRALAHAPYRRTIEVAPGETTRIEARPERRGKTWLWTGVGLTVAALAVEGLALGAHFQAGRYIAGSSDYDRWHTLELAGHVTAGVLGAGAVASYGMYLWGQRSGGEAPPAPSGGVRAAAAPTLLPGGAGLVVTGRF